MNEFDRIIHFGVYSTTTTPPSIAGRTDPRTIRQVTLPKPFTFTEAIIDGSWGCWGAADQDPEGDQSLHVAVRFGFEPNAEMIGLVYEALAQLVEAPSYLLAHGTVTTSDHSETELNWIYDPGSRRVGVNFHDYDVLSEPMRGGGPTWRPPRVVEGAPALKEPFCAYTNDAMVDDRGLHFVAYVEQDEPGYYSTTYTGTLEYCQSVAAEVNKTLGLTPEQANEIVMSSMRVSR